MGERIVVVEKGEGKREREWEGGRPGSRESVARERGGRTGSVCCGMWCIGITRSPRDKWQANGVVMGGVTTPYTHTSFSLQ